MKEILSQYGCDAILITNLGMVRYLCGFRGSSGTLLYMKNKMLFFTDGRYKLEAEKEVKNAIVLVYEKGRSLLQEILPQTLKEYNISRLGYFEDDLKVSMYHKLLGLTTLVPLTFPISKPRTCKTRDEISNIKEAATISEKAFDKSIEKLISEPTEKELAAFLEYQMLMLGAEKPSFDSIVAFHSNSALPHAKPGNKKISGNGFLLMDFGAKYNGYCSDETVTLFIGKPNKEQKKMYEHVWTAQKKALDAVKTGVSASNLYKLAYNYLDEKGYGKYIQHGLGHGVGIDIHEFPSLHLDSEDIILEGMVITIEPGLYIPNIGGVRIEDTLLVKSSGYELITTIPKELKIII